MFKSYIEHTSSLYPGPQHPCNFLMQSNFQARHNDIYHGNKNPGDGGRGGGEDGDGRVPCDKKKERKKSKTNFRGLYIVLNVSRVNNLYVKIGSQGKKPQFSEVSESP